MLTTRRATCAVVTGLVLLILSIAAPAQSSDKSTKGQEIFKSKCASCHGIDGKGQTKAGQLTQAPDLTKTPWKHGNSQAEVEKITREGFKKMPKYEGKLTAAEITAVSQYVRTFCDAKK